MRRSLLAILATTLSLLCTILALGVDWYEFEVSWRPARLNLGRTTGAATSIETAGIFTAFPFAQIQYSPGLCRLASFISIDIPPRIHRIIPSTDQTRNGITAIGTAGLIVFIHLVLLIRSGSKKAMMVLLATLIGTILLAFILPKPLPNLVEAAVIIRTADDYNESTPIWLALDSEKGKNKCPVYGCIDERCTHSEPGQSTYSLFPSNSAEWRFIRLLPQGTIYLATALILGIISKFIRYFPPRKA